MELTVVILAAGQGKRMKSALPKVLQPLAGKPLLGHVVGVAKQLEPAGIVVVHGDGGAQVRAAMADYTLNWAQQAEQLGTGHAVKQALPQIDPKHRVLILCGDVPLIQPKTLEALIAAAGDSSLAVLTAQVADPTGYGRIIRDAHDRVRAIVEEKDASPEQRAVTEINTGLIACPAHSLGIWLEQLKANNAQGEYYLTDIIGLAVDEGTNVEAVLAESEVEVMGINDKLQLAEAERAFQLANARSLMKQGVTLADPDRIDVRGELICGKDVYIDVNAIFEGRVELGDNVRIESNTVIRDSVIGAGTRIHPNCVIEEAMIAANCQIGPYARLRPGVELSEEVKLGNFVELKKSIVGSGSKVNHLSYIGDTTIGTDVNVGAGTITCNYDGANKHRTIIGDGAFIGSGVQLVAPVEVGAEATIGAGSTISKSTPAGELTVERSKQTVVRGWKRPTKEKKD